MFFFTDVTREKNF